MTTAARTLFAMSVDICTATGYPQGSYSGAWRAADHTNQPDGPLPPSATSRRRSQKSSASARFPNFFGPA
jgi:hypothetical protein